MIMDELSMLICKYKDMKFLMDNLVPQLTGHEVKDVAKMIMTMIKDPECKFLCLSESTETGDSDKGMPDQVDEPDEGDILAQFPRDMLMNEV